MDLICNDLARCTEVGGEEWRLCGLNFFVRRRNRMSVSHAPVSIPSVAEILAFHVFFPEDIRKLLCSVSPMGLIRTFAFVLIV